MRGEPRGSGFEVKVRFKATDSSSCSGVFFCCLFFSGNRCLDFGDLHECTHVFDHTGSIMMVVLHVLPGDKEYKHNRDVNTDRFLRHVEKLD